MIQKNDKKHMSVSKTCIIFASKPIKGCPLVMPKGVNPSGCIKDFTINKSILYKNIKNLYYNEK